MSTDFASRTAPLESHLTGVFWDSLRITQAFVASIRGYVGLANLIPMHLNHPLRIQNRRSSVPGGPPFHVIPDQP